MIYTAIENLPETDTMLSIFSEYIRRDYGELLDRNRRTPVQIIKRCTEKGLLQQALTFAESLMPAFIMNSGFLLFNLQKILKQPFTYNEFEMQKECQKFLNHREFRHSYVQ